MKLYTCKPKYDWHGLCLIAANSLEEAKEVLSKECNAYRYDTNRIQELEGATIVCDWAHVLAEVSN